jgi:hypothetical protein
VSAEDHVRLWLGQNLTGCNFSGLIANRSGGLVMATFRAMASPEELDRVFDLAAGQSLPVVAVFPELRTEKQISEQLMALSGGERWRVWRVPTPAGLETDDVFVGLEWKTAAATIWSSPMGLAPLGTMPVTRRAPHTCIAAWTGGHQNKFRRTKDPVVHFLDVDLTGYRLDADKYKRRTVASKEATAAILLNDKASYYRNVAFRLSASVKDQLAALSENKIPAGA